MPRIKVGACVSTETLPDTLEGLTGEDIASVVLSRDESGRFKESPDSAKHFIVAKRHVERAKEAVKFTLDDAQDLARHVSKLTTEQIKTLKRETGVKASGPTKAALVNRLEERLRIQQSSRINFEAGGTHMAKLTKAERDKLPEADFGDSSRRLFPITDQDDVDSAAHLIGKAKDPVAVKRRIMAIAKRKGLKLPDAWAKEQAHFEQAEAALAKAETEFASFVATMDGGTTKDEKGYVIHKAEVFFKAGEYPDKPHEFSLTPEEHALALEAVKQVPIRISHLPTSFEGQYGHAIFSTLSDDFVTSGGEVHLHPGIDQLLRERGQTELSVSWNRATKRPSHVALVPAGRIDGAVLVADFEAAFAAKKVEPPPVTSPVIVPPPASDFAATATYHGKRMLQDIHDMASKSGALCGDKGKPNPQMAVFMASHEGKALQIIHDSSVDGGAKCVWHQDHAVLPGYANYSDEAKKEVDRLNKELAEAKAGTEAAFEVSIKASAAAFAAQQKSDDKITPGQVADTEAEFMQAAMDDRALGNAASFGSSRVQRLRQKWAMAPKTGLTKEKLAAADFAVTILDNRTAPLDKDAETERLQKAMEKRRDEQNEIVKRNGKV